METRESPQTLHTILVVEDEVFTRMVISEYLRDCGYKVLEAAHAEEALVLLQHSEVGIDVVFSTVEMPGTLDGFQLAKWLREHRPNVDVILTGNITRAANAAAELCESTSLPKPYEPRIAVERIKQLIALRRKKSE